MSNVGSSIESKRKIADAHMNLSNKLWSSIFNALLIIPITCISKSILDSTPVRLGTIFNQVGEYFWVLFVYVFIVGIFVKLSHRKAIKIYDGLEEGK